MKIVKTVLVIILLFYAAFLFYAHNMPLVHTAMNRIQYPTPITWNGISFKPDERMVCIKNADDRIILSYWGKENPRGSIGARTATIDYSKCAPKCIMDLPGYSFLHTGYINIDNKELLLISHRDNSNDELLVIIPIPNSQLALIYLGPEDNYKIFERTLSKTKLPS